MRLVCLMTGEISEPTLADLLTSNHEVVGLVTQPDRPVGRKQVLTAPGVKVIAAEAGVPVIQPESIKSEESLAQIQDWRPELIVVMAYGQILPQRLIDLPSRAIINLHASLLPKYRGASCIQAALRNGDHETGWSVIYVVKKLDAGRIILQQPLPILEGETGGQLHDRLAQAGPSALRKALELFASGEVEGREQEESGQTYVPKLTREDGIIDWSRPADEIERLARAYHPWPGTSSTLGGKRLKIFPPVGLSNQNGDPGQFLDTNGDGLVIACGKGSLILDQVQMEGSRRMSGRELLLGHRDLLEGGLK